MDQLSIYLALLGLLSLSCQWLGWYLKLPAILLLLLTGFFIKPLLDQWIVFTLSDDFFFPLISLAVAIILFEGALTLSLHQIKGHGRMVTNLISIGMGVTWIILTLACRYIMDTNWMVASLFAALVVVTGPTVILPFLRAVQPTSKIANILMWEGILIDPLGAVLAVLVYEFVVNNHNTLQMLTLYSSMLGIGIVLGSIAGWCVGQALRRHWFPQYLINVAVMVVMLGFYVLSNELSEESGLITVTVMGVVLANMKDVDVAGISEFKEALSVLLISSLFIELASRVTVNDFIILGTPVFGLLAIVIFVARPMCIWISSLGTKGLNWKELTFLSCISPRGIVAAAVTTLIAIKLEQAQVEDAELLLPLVFSVIVSTVVLQSLTAGFMAQILGVKSLKDKRILIFGAGAFARKYALVLQEYGMDVVLADPNWMNTSQARMDGLEVYFGNPTTEEAKKHIDLNSLGHLFICSPYSHMNHLVAHDLDDILDPSEVDHLTCVNLPRQPLNQEALFGGYSYQQLTGMIRQGAEIKTTPISETFTVESFEQSLEGECIVLAYFKENTFQMVYQIDEPMIQSADVLVYLHKKPSVSIA